MSAMKQSEFPIYYIFANLRDQVVSPSKSDPNPPVIKRGRRPEFWQLRFKSADEAVRTFYDDIGLLSDIPEEAPVDFWKTANKVKRILDTGLTPLNKRLMNELLEPLLFRSEVSKKTNERIYIPRSLVGKIVSDLVNDLLQGAKIGHCAYCKRPMVLGGTQSNYRADAKFCCGGCKTADSYWKSSS